MRLVRGSKWEWTIFAAASGSAILSFVFIVLHWEKGDAADSEWWIGWAAAILVASIAFAYRLGLRTQRRIDQLQLAMKQAAAGNWNVRLPELSADAFAEAYSEFNGMLAKLEDRLKLLQRLGEQEVREEGTSKEAAVLEERRRLARDLHDTVSQQLFALHMSASSLPMLLKKNPEQAEQVMRQLIDMSAMAQRQMRGLIAQLRPLELQGRTLSDALNRWFPDYCRQNGLQGTLEMQLEQRLPEAIEHQLFLIIQEAMANVVKHAEAKAVRLLLGTTDRQVTLTVEDDGCGFRHDQVRAGGHGLSTMRERAQKLGGDAEIVTKAGAGTCVRVSFPIFAAEMPDEHDNEKGIRAT